MQRVFDFFKGKTSPVEETSEISQAGQYPQPERSQRLSQPSQPSQYSLLSHPRTSLDHAKRLSVHDHYLIKNRSLEETEESQSYSKEEETTMPPLPHHYQPKSSSYPPSRYRDLSNYGTSEPVYQVSGYENERPSSLPERYQSQARYQPQESFKSASYTPSSFPPSGSQLLHYHPSGHHNQEAKLCRERENVGKILDSPPLPPTPERRSLDNEAALSHPPSLGSLPLSQPPSTLLESNEETQTQASVKYSKSTSITTVPPKYPTWDVLVSKKCEAPEEMRRVWEEAQRERITRKIVEEREKEMGKRATMWGLGVGLEGSGR